MSNPPLLTLELIQQAREIIGDRLHRTPLIRSRTLSEQLGANVHLKLESLQKTGSFKPRGAFAKLLSLSDTERQSGVVGVSGGNHAQGLAYAAQQLGISATICMPESTPNNYVAATRDYGAEIVFCPDIHHAFAKADQLQAQGRVLIHPFDDALLAAGQGTVALEILEDLPTLDRIYISIGGGGLIVGMATALKALRPDITIVGVETRGADVMSQSVAANRLVELPAITSIARTLGAPRASEFTLHGVQQLVDRLMVVEDAATVAELILLLERTKQLVEPAAACCLAAAREDCSHWQPTDNVVILLCGGNASLQDVAKWSGAE